MNSAGGVIAANTGSVSNILVTGSGSQWNNSSFLSVGTAGGGTLNITNGGLVSDTCPVTCAAASAAIIGDLAGSNGTVTVSGAGSTWNNVGQVTVGNFGTGALNITNGGLVSDNCPATCSAAVIGYNAGVSGTVTVSGAGSAGTMVVW